jgi:hypothetical protein
LIRTLKTTTMNEPLGDIWDELEQTSTQSGKVYRRLHPESDRDLRAVFDPATRTRTLLFERLWRPTDTLPPLVQSRAVRMEARRNLQGTRMTLLMRLSDDAFTDVFTILAGDVAAAAARAPDDREATTALFDQLERWRRLLEDLRDNGLQSRFRRGLFAELHLLSNLLIQTLGARTALEGWTGPDRANQDFQYERCAVEVKSTAGQQPQSIVVANERELDETGTGTLYLCHVSIDERRGGRGASLNEAVGQIEEALGADMVARGLLQERLVRYGYHAHQHALYLEPRYAIREEHLYRVTADFPRITESRLPRGVGAVRYSISLAACGPHRVEQSELLSDLVTGSAGRNG